MTRSTFTWAALLAVLFTSCSGEGTPKGSDLKAEEIEAMDTHTHASASAARITHLDLDVQVAMDTRTISGTAGYAIRPNGSDTIFLDTDGLNVAAVRVDGQPVEFQLGDSTLLGRALGIPIKRNSKQIAVDYKTTSDAKALQWLSPQQTADRKHPFLFTQGQAILTRTWIPVQDSPGIRFTYNARVKVPAELMAVMSAANPQQRSAEGVYTFSMEQAIPAYLIALAVGDLDFRPLGERTGVYAERSMVEKAAWEFADTERMLEAAEALYGPYRWGRYDVIVLPPSFPFGGMENPRLTFATPTIIAGDRSLTALIAHELAHSWSGNLVTNATWNDFWLNEGFTVYFENRISEALYGESHAGMLQILGRQDLQGTLARLETEGHGADTHLRLHLEGRDPDDGMTDIAYEKGFAFLKLLEAKVGREKFDAFLRGYFDTFAFQSMTTDRFLTYLDEQLLAPNNVQLDITAWVDGPGLPADAPTPVSDKFTKVDAEVVRWQQGTAAASLNTKEWSTFEWMHFLRHLPKDLTDAQLNDLDNAFGLTKSGNAEVLAAWLEQCIRNDHDVAYPTLDRFLNTVGRRKFLVPLYTELIATEKGRLMAQDIYRSSRQNYHAVAVRTLDELLAWSANKPPATF
ncbi:MAG: M1 family metallopeptidase [Flavobacteriales bacterium]|nr:M1 family metallopeptidase [Flavobacteriales bacterium]